MNICLVSQEYPLETPWGGIGTQTRNKARGLARLGHNVHVLTRAANQGPHVRTEMDDGVTIHLMRPPGFDFTIYGRGTYLLGYTWHVLGQLQRLMESVSLDVIDFPEFGGEGFAYQLDRTCWNWVPVVVQLHGPLEMFTRHMAWPEPETRFARFGTFLESFCIKEADALMACSACIADLTSGYYGVPREVIDVVHCGVDAEHFAPAPDGDAKAKRPTVLFVGNLVENKGTHTVFEACLRLLPKYPDLHLQIVGRVSEENELVANLRARLASERAGRNIELVGFVGAGDLPSFYCRAHVFCSPAEFEGGVANVYLEAMACGCPVVASTAGGGPEAVVEEETGLLVPPGDVAATAAALDRILGDPPLCRRMGVAARRRIVDYFAMDKYVLRILHVYEKAIARSQNNPARSQDHRE
jgi:glycosyltransferase involved in cell wall biosynthesis